MLRYCLTTAAAVLTLCAPLAAQAVSFDTPTQPTVGVDVVAPAPTQADAAASGPAANVTVARPVHASTPASIAFAPPPQTSQRSVAMMVVGGAGLLVGAVVGGKAGSIIMIGGGAVGLVGLWNYMK